ncbi:MAG: DUF805 domain-containing protein [Gammaproteobacteria bacterium AqS3]|nr:DUF805 domain-containing protein [Gammaproteobacteria bacterium AqS3]
MDFFAAVKSVAWTNYFRLRGRASRAEVWWFVLFYLLVYTATILGDIYALGIDVSRDVGPLNTIFSLLFFIPAITLLVRRLHDIGRSGYWAWLILLGLPILGGIALAPLVSLIPLPATLSLMLTGMAFLGGVALGLVISFVIQIIIALIDSQMHDNKYGPIPPHKVQDIPQPYSADQYQAAGQDAQQPQHAQAEYADQQPQYSQAPVQQEQAAGYDEQQSYQDEAPSSEPQQQPPPDPQASDSVEDPTGEHSEPESSGSRQV